MLADTALQPVCGAESESAVVCFCDDIAAEYLCAVTEEVVLVEVDALHELFCEFLLGVILFGDSCFSDSPCFYAEGQLMPEDNGVFLLCFRGCGAVSFAEIEGDIETEKPQGALSIGPAEKLTFSSYMPRISPIA